MVRRPQHRAEREPFSLNVENPGRFLKGGGSGVEASRKLGRGRGLRKAHKAPAAPRLAFSLPLQLSPPPALLVPVLPHLLLSFCASLST